MTAPDAPTPHPELRLYDTRRRAVVPFEPIVAGQASIYTCGPTVYAPQTLGNMRSQFTPDLLRRLLLADGYDVTFVTNITDVGHLVGDGDEGDDKMEKAATAEGKTAEEIAAHWTDQWATDRRRLGMLEPDHLPKATEYLPQQIELIQKLEAGGHTYRIGDGIYFDVSTYPGYADFAGLDLAEMEASGRVDNIADKRQPADFALWKFSPEGSTRLQEWDSPWGVGFPGWHIECSAMSTDLLGVQFDIHTGGVDHIRVHHTNEIAQTECALGVHPWVPIWVHTEFLNLGTEKISKSKGHVLVVDTLVDEGIDPLAFRYFLLQSHYRQQQAFSIDLVRSAGTALRRLVHHAVAARDEVGGEVAAHTDRAGELAEAFWSALRDDLNTPKAMSFVSTVARDPELSAGERWSLLADFDRVLGFGLAEATDPDASGDVSDDPDVADALARRQAAKAAKDFATADAIRDELVARGVDIVDTPAGPRARRR